MNRLTCYFTMAILLTGLYSLQAQTPQAAEATSEHEWLHQLVGEWEVESEMVTETGEVTMKSKGTMSTRKLGEVWVVTDMTGEMPGMKMTALQTIGYSDAKEKFIGTWIDSVTDYMWHYEGSLDESRKKLTLEAEGADFTTGKTTKFRDAYEIKSADEMTLTSSMLDSKGKWVTFMNGKIRRKK